MIRPLTFIDTSIFTAQFIVKYKQQMVDGRLDLRVPREDGELGDTGVLKEWKAARALMQRIRNAAAAAFDGQVPDLGRVYVETLPPHSGIPWWAETAEDAADFVRVRICMVPNPQAFTFSGAASVILAVGIATVIDHRLLCSEVNHGDTPRTHLIVDVRLPNAEA